MATTFIEPGGDSDFGTNFWPIVSGATAVSDIVHGGHLRSIKLRPNTSDEVAINGVVSDAGGRYSIWVYINAAATTVGAFIGVNQLNNANNVIFLTITPGGVLQLNDNNQAQIGSNGATLSTGQWYRLSLAFVLTSSTVNTIKLWVNGALSISVTNYNFPTVSTSQVAITNGAGDATFDFRASDIYTDNSSALTDPGNIWVTAKRPFSNGTTNGFTASGTSSGYGSGNAENVNYRPLQTATANVNKVGAGSAVTEEYNIESVSTGDINITGATIVDWMGWLYAKSLAGETGSIIVGGANSNISLTSTTTLFTKIKGSTTYPAGTGSDIGIITTTALTTVTLYDAGIIVAYIPAVVAATTNYLPLLGVGS